MDPINIDDDNRRLCEMIRCLVQEWNPRSLEILVPRKWGELAAAAGREVYLNFVTDDSVVLIFACHDGTSFRREVKLSSSCFLN